MSGVISGSQIDNSGIVGHYPAGHYVQTTAIVSGTSYTTLTTPTNNAWASTIVTAAITPLFNDSSILVQSSFGVRAASTEGGIGYSLRFWKSATGITDNYPDGMSHFGSGVNQHASVYRGPHQYTDHNTTWEMNLMDASSGTTNAITYTLYASTYDLTHSGSSLMVGGQYSSFWHIFFQEIKR